MNIVEKYKKVKKHKENITYKENSIINVYKAVNKCLDDNRTYITFKDVNTIWDSMLLEKLNFDRDYIYGEIVFIFNEKSLMELQNLYTKIKDVEVE